MRLLFVMLLTATLVPQPVRAGDGVAVFDLAPGARAAALGMTGSADVTDPVALVNPALAASCGGLTIHSAYGHWSGDVDHFTNAFAWAGNVGALRMGVGLAHSRLEFKTYERDYGYLPFNTQSSFMTATAALRRAGRAGAVSAGFSLAWSTSDGGGDEVLVDAGLLLESPPVALGGARLRCALAASSLHAGAGDGVAAVANTFARGTGGEALRYGISAAGDAGVAGARIDADVIDTGRDGSTDATAAGVEVSLWDTVHARAGYGDGIAGGYDVVTVGGGLGRRVGGIHVRLDYARIEDARNHVRGVALGADVFAVRLQLDL